jgi:hypothetical protein
MFKESAVAVAMLLATGTAIDASAQSYGLGGNYQFSVPKTMPPPPPPMMAPPPAFHMPPNQLGAQQIPSLRDLGPTPTVLPPRSAPVALPVPKTVPTVNIPDGQPPRQVDVGVQHSVNSTTQVGATANVSPNLPAPVPGGQAPNNGTPQVTGGSVSVQKSVP